ncbi:MAG: saccharopine dehydrogenase NADP-binding domain-containing protein [Bacteroidota bacterium]
MNAAPSKLMIYGATGYSAQLILEELISRKVKPILAGRNESGTKKIADKFDCEYRVFDLTDDTRIDKALNDIHTLLNCAGPFRMTAKELIEACLRTKTNYLDITGEIPVMHLAFSMSKRAKKNRIVIMPSVGFDIIPTDCLAKRLSEKMPDAANLKLGLINKRGKISRGTWLTTLEFLKGMGRIRRDGKLIESPIGEYAINVKLKNFSFSGLSIPWGDVYSSFRSTGIPNGEVYIAMPERVVKFRKLLTLFLKIFRIKFVKNFTASYIQKNLTGPSKKERDSAKTYVWGRVENAKGEMIEEVYQVMEGYNLTAVGAAECTIRILNNSVGPGFYTPSLAFGSAFMDQFVIRRIY